MARASLPSVEDPGSERSAWGSWWLEHGLMVIWAGFCAWCFELDSPVNGPDEVFGQDSAYIIRSLADDQPYPWNPQNHLLYHTLVEHLYALLPGADARTMESVYRFLKGFTALCGLGWLLMMRQVFVELEMARALRVALLGLAGVSVSAWFHVSAFETHALALPAMGGWLWAVARWDRARHRTGFSRVVMVLSLVVGALCRIELLFVPLVAFSVLALQSGGREARKLLAELGLVVGLAVGGSALLAWGHLEYAPQDSVTAAFSRQDRPSIEDQLMRVEHLQPGYVLQVARAVSVYSVVMPVMAVPAEHPFAAPPQFSVDQVSSRFGQLQGDTQLFREPVQNLLGTAVSAAALVCTLPLLAGGLLGGLWEAKRGNRVAAASLAVGLSGLLLYTWFNPHEPFLWGVEFLPLWLIWIGLFCRRLNRFGVVWVFAAAGSVAVHNWYAFFETFR